MQANLDMSELPDCLNDVTRDDVEIVFLGTGSSQPSKYRNVSSIFINLFSKGGLLLDCGEGTLGQLRRRFGIKAADEAIKSLRCIWISHIHADHHTGVTRILSLQSSLLKGIPHEPLILVGPTELKIYLDTYPRVEDLDMQFLDFRHTKQAKNGEITGEVPILNSLKKVLLEAGLETLTSFPVIHRTEAFGVALKASSRVNRVGKTIPGWKIVYSGDTKYCPDLVKASHGATVLIHEATFDDSLEHEAKAKGHSTTRDAIEAGYSSGAYRLILTHFSQRYPKIPKVDKDFKHYMPEMCVAFDLMSVNLADLPLLPRVWPCLELMFKDDMVNDEPEDAEF